MPLDSSMQVHAVCTQLLPDIITLPLLWAGLIYQLAFQPYWLGNAVIGALAEDMEVVASWRSARRDRDRDRGWLSS